MQDIMQNPSPPVARPNRNRKPRVPRVAKVLIDQLAACPTCGDAMRLTENHNFECKPCGLQVAPEQVRLDQAS